MIRGCMFLKGNLVITSLFFKLQEAVHSLASMVTFSNDQTYA